jgi:hypothetical protein
LSETFLFREELRALAVLAPLRNRAHRDRFAFAFAAPSCTILKLKSFDVE